MMPTFRLMVFLFVFVSFFTNAQQSSLGNWMIYIGNKKIDEQWNWHHEVQYRNYNAVGDLEQLLLRTGLGYTPKNSELNFLLGYGYILSENYVGQGNVKESVHEHRVFQQLVTKQLWWGRTTASHRYRFEQRWAGENFKSRFRYMLSLRFPIAVSFVDKEKLYFSAYNEIFLNTENKIFDRNRVYGGVGVQINKSFRVEAGYMTQIFDTNSRDQINLITFVNF